MSIEKKHSIPTFVIYLLASLICIYLIAFLTALYTGPLRTSYVKNVHAQEQSEIVISFTTTPYRIDKIKPVLDSLKNQSLKASNIYINIPYIFERDNLPYTIPAWLENYTGVTILRDKDYGPGTKLITTLKHIENPETLIITVDDDVLHDKHLVRDLYYKSYKNPNSIISNTNFRFKIDLNSIDVLSDLYMTFEDESESLLAVGSGGVIYKRKFFTNDFYSLINSLPKFCRLSDDLYFSMYAHSKDISIIQNHEGAYNNLRIFYPQHHELVYGLQTDALRYGANGYGDNSVNYQRCIKYFAKVDPNFLQPIIDKGNSLKRVRNFISYFLVPNTNKN